MHRYKISEDVHMQVLDAYRQQASLEQRRIETFQEALENIEDCFNLFDSSVDSGGLVH